MIAVGKIYFCEDPENIFEIVYRKTKFQIFFHKVIYIWCINKINALCTCSHTWVMSQPCVNYFGSR